MKNLTRQEEELMLCFWQLESGTVKEAMALMSEQQPYTTVASTARNLETKGYLSSRKVGNTYLYTPAVKQSDYKRSVVNHVIKGYFQNSYKELVSFFAREHKLNADDLKEIIEIIEQDKEDRE